MAAAKENLVVGGGKSVFEDIGIAMSPADMLKVNLAAFVSGIIQAKGLTQAEAFHAL